MHKLLHFWYHKNKRNLPWRHTLNPYHIWLSEIILQQTRVEQGLPYYLKFTHNYNSIIDFANADLNDILKLWQGLGYYSRARNMHIAAQYIRDNYNGNFPDNYIELVKLQGIGPYTAAAIASFAFNESKAVVDGNVYRVIARFAGIFTDINSTIGKHEFAKIADELLDKNNPATHNQAMMELGAMVCKPQNPDCFNCPININCFAYLGNEQKNLPVKINKVKVKTRFFNYFIFEINGNTYLNQRGANDIWQGLFEFPLVEKPLFTNEMEVFKELIDSKYYDDISDLKIVFMGNYKHILTHQILQAGFWKITSKTKPNLDPNFIEIKIDEINNYAVPKLLENLITNDKLQHQIF
ncbi:MAG: A/G-specific adenine glycosylase [Bacteroidia bacterium]|nr:A/G-specific adenine glycosylase [Bacteroidia bacterium]